MKIKEYYLKICELEKIDPVPIKFGRVGKAGACLTYDSRNMTPLYISFDNSKLVDIEYALYHEFAHQVCLMKYKDPGHGSKFKKEFNRINDKYMYSKLSFKYLTETIMKKSELKELIKEEIKSLLSESIDRNLALSMAENYASDEYKSFIDKPSIKANGNEESWSLEFKLKIPKENYGWWMNTQDVLEDMSDELNYGPGSGDNPGQAFYRLNVGEPKSIGKFWGVTIYVRGGLDI